MVVASSNCCTSPIITIRILSYRNEYSPPANEDDVLLQITKKNHEEETVRQKCNHTLLSL
jgi:hypothetical protein